MIDALKNLSKECLSYLGIFLSHNQRYDWQLKKIIHSVKPNEGDIALIDIGAHKGEVSDIALRTHHNKCLLFEPIPALYERLIKKYENSTNAVIYNLGLSNTKGSSTFQYNHSHPAYSGILKREYPTANEHVEEITIKTDTLDNIIDILNPTGISLIKIDVEGGELNVLKGAKQTIQKFKPLVVFEHGLGASEFYNTKPEDVFEYFKSLNMQLQTMEMWFNKNASGFTQEAFSDQFNKKLNYYFIAYPED